MASQNRASGGDSYHVNLLERPFTANSMIYHPEIDINKVELSKDNTFYYFSIYLNNVAAETNT